MAPRGTAAALPLSFVQTQTSLQSLPGLPVTLLSDCDMNMWHGKSSDRGLCGQTDPVQGPPSFALTSWTILRKSLNFYELQFILFLNIYIITAFLSEV